MDGASQPEINHSRCRSHPALATLLGRLHLQLTPNLSMSNHPDLAVAPLDMVALHTAIVLNRCYWHPATTLAHIAIF